MGSCGCDIANAPKGHAKNLIGPVLEIHRQCRDNIAVVGRLQSRKTAPNSDPGIRPLSMLWCTNARSSARLRFASIARWTRWKCWTAHSLKHRWSFGEIAEAQVINNSWKIHSYIAPELIHSTGWIDSDHHKTKPWAMQIQRHALFKKRLPT
jgi:hypothetical protein